MCYVRRRSAIFTEVVIEHRRIEELFLRRVDSAVDVAIPERPEHFRTSDLPLLCQYVESVSLAARATQELQRDDPPARWLTLWEKANRNMVALSARLRLSPQSRMPNNPTRKSPERVSFYERMQLAGELDGPERPD